MTSEGIKGKGSIVLDKGSIFILINVIKMIILFLSPNIVVEDQHTERNKITSIHVFQMLGNFILNDKSRQ